MVTFPVIGGNYGGVKLKERKKRINRWSHKQKYRSNSISGELRRLSVCLQNLTFNSLWNKHGLDQCSIDDQRDFKFQAGVREEEIGRRKEGEDDGEQMRGIEISEINFSLDLSCKLLLNVANSYSLYQIPSLILKALFCS